MFKRVVGIPTAAVLTMVVAHYARADLPTAPPTSTVNDRKDAAPPLIREAQSKNQPLRRRQFHRQCHRGRNDRL